MDSSIDTINYELNAENTAPQEYSAQSEQLLSDYVGKLFSEGEFYNVINFSHKAIEDNPMNLDLVVYRACSYIVLAVSDTSTISDKEVMIAIEHLELVIRLIGSVDEYDQSLDYYIALGKLVLGEFEMADSLIDALPDYDDIPDAIDYYERRREHWITKNNYIPTSRHMGVPLPS